MNPDVIWCEGCGCERPSEGSEEREAPHGMGTYTICRECVAGEPEAIAYEESRRRDGHAEQD